MSYSLVLIGGAERREQIKRWLGGRHDISVIGEIADTHGLRLLPPLQPDIVALDCAAPTINALAVLPWLSTLPEARHIIALGASGEPAEQRLMLELGALAYAPPRSKEAFLRALALIERLTTIAGRAGRLAAGLHLRYSPN